MEQYGKAGYTRIDLSQDLIPLFGVELQHLGIVIRFADYPGLNPIDPDDQIFFSLSFTLARRESIKLGQRVTGGLHAKLRTGGVGKAPDGCEEKTEQIDKTRAGRYNWIEPDLGSSKCGALSGIYCGLTRTRSLKFAKGTIQRMELLPPFAYLKEVTDYVRTVVAVLREKTKPARWLVCM